MEDEGEFELLGETVGTKGGEMLRLKLLPVLGHATNKKIRGD